MPVPDSVSSFSNTDSKRLDDYRSTSELPKKTDIVVIGSGLSGVATAYFILKDNPNSPSIEFLEARKICSGATGRNGGHVKPDTYSDIPKFTKLSGMEAAAQLADFEARHVHEIKDLVEKEDLDFCTGSLESNIYVGESRSRSTPISLRFDFESNLTKISRLALGVG